MDWLSDIYLCKNKEIELSAQPHEVFGMLLYAKTDEAVLPNNSYKMSGNTISVKTLIWIVISLKLQIS